MRCLGALRPLLLPHPCALPQRAPPCHKVLAAKSLQSCLVDGSKRRRSSVASGDSPAHVAPAKRRPPVAVGSRIAAVDTPALVVRLDDLEANIKNMTASLGAVAPSVAIRPHLKGHKTIEIASLQMKQERHIGVSCQKVSEAVAIADDVGDILLTSEIVSLPKASRLATLARRGCTVTAVVDSQESLAVLTSAARAQGVRLGVLIDVDVGQGRCGVASAEEAVKLATAITEVDALNFRGIQTLHGFTQHIRQWHERKAAAEEVAQRARRVMEALKDAGFPCDTVTGGGTGTCVFDAASGVFTEVQPGSYALGDGNYSMNLDASGMFVSLWRQSLFVASTVISRNDAARRVVLDAGLKATSHGSRPAVGPDTAADAVPTVELSGDEHTVLHFKNGGRLPAVGEQVLLVPGHCDLTVNMHDYIIGVRRDVVEEVWPVVAGGPGW